MQRVDLDQLGQLDDVSVGAVRQENLHPLLQKQSVCVCVCVCVKHKSLEGQRWSVAKPIEVYLDKTTWTKFLICTDTPTLKLDFLKTSQNNKNVNYDHETCRKWRVPEPLVCPCVLSWQICRGSPVREKHS